MDEAEYTDEEGMTHHGPHQNPFLLTAREIETNAMLAVSSAGRDLALARHRGQRYKDLSRPARVLVNARYHHGAGSGRPRKHYHNPDLMPRCPCVECRKTRHQYPGYVIHD